LKKTLIKIVGNLGLPGTKEGNGYGILEYVYNQVIKFISSFP
jgi:hypothetical protein